MGYSFRAAFGAIHIKIIIVYMLNRLKSFKGWLMHADAFVQTACSPNTGICYYYEEDGLTWQDAYDYCWDSGRLLAVFDTWEEYDWYCSIGKYVTSYIINHGTTTNASYCQEGLC